LYQQPADEADLLELKLRQIGFVVVAYVVAAFAWLR
jgi:hypothetical protein